MLNITVQADAVTDRDPLDAGTGQEAERAFGLPWLTGMPAFP
jgi:hypothetical protein